MSKSPLEASEVMGLTKLETAFQVVLPESANDLISQIIFMFEYNFRHGTVIGLVGAGGIGRRGIGSGNQSNGQHGSAWHDRRGFGYRPTGVRGDSGTQGVRVQPAASTAARR